MRSDSPSQTAMATAFLRALHLVVDEPPHVFEDTLAAQFLPGYQQRFLERLRSLPTAWLGVFRQRRSYLGGIRAQVLVRARYSEDALAAARTDPGIGRYVILAAGVDTFAWRQDEHEAVPVVEVDHPATQRWKRRHLEQQGRPQPRNLTFAAVDFERSTLTEALPRPDTPQFISWLGTTYYLKPASVAATLTALAELSPPGSRLVLDYWQAAPGFGDGAGLLWGARMATALQMEPMLCFLGPDELEAMARQCGWRVRANLAAAAQNERYLAGRRDDLKVPGFAWLAELER